MFIYPESFLDTDSNVSWTWIVISWVVVYRPIHTVCQYQLTQISGCRFWSLVPFRTAYPMAAISLEILPLLCYKLFGFWLSTDPSLSFAPGIRLRFII